MPVQAINGRCLKCGYRLAWVLVRGKTSAELGASRFNVWYTLEPKKKNRPEVIRTVSSIFGDFCFRTFVPHIDRCYRSRHRGVSCPVAATLSGRPDAGDRRYRTGASKSNSPSFFMVSICQGVMFSRSRPPDLVNSRSLHNWPKDRLLCPKDRIYFSSAKAI
jgi:hypothetical protein